MLHTVATINSNGWLHQPNTDKGLIPRKGLLTSEIATTLGEDALSIRQRIRDGSLPGVRLTDRFGLVIAYAMTASEISDHFTLTPNQELGLKLSLSIDVIPSVGHDYRHRLTYSAGMMNDIHLRTEFSTFDELKAENPQSSLSDIPASEWRD